MKIRSDITAWFLFVLFLQGCSCPSTTSQESQHQPEGMLFIIGGGKRPDAMIREMITLSGVDEGGYVAVLPMASSEPDTSFFYAKKDFVKHGITDVFNFNFQKDEVPSQSRLDSLRKAHLIYITGGVQSEFMDIVLHTAVHEAIKNAYRDGSLVAGTSAGAAVMSKKMLTGNEFKHPEYTGDFRTIEAENMEITRGLGLLENAIIDQHFIRRMRMNRLITVAIENPDQICIGIDESTAIIVERDTATVTGQSQVIVLRSIEPTYSVQKGLLGKKNMHLSVFLPGERFSIKD